MRILTIAATCVGFSLVPPATADEAKGKAVSVGKNAVIFGSVSHANLTLFPVFTTSVEASKVDYLVLDEGMKSKQVVVLEKGDDGEVNELTLRNTSDQPLFLMAGEVIIGGKQDRIIGKNTVVAPRTTETVPVFCVEHGRWSGRKASFESAEALAHTELRKKASFASQAAVWDEVKSKNAKRKVSNDTDTYRQVAKSQSVRDSVAGYQKAFARQLGAQPDRARQVGFVVALDGQVVAIETFGSPKLFRKFEKKLLSSYFVEAIDHHSDLGKPRPAPSAVTASEFAGKARRAKKQVVLDKASGKTVHFSQDNMQGSQVEAAGEEVYQSAYK